MRKSAGFTFVELVVTMIIIGIVAAVALPRFSDTSSFESMGFRDEVAGLLRYAQKAAVAQRRTVCVAIATTGVTLTIDNATPADGTCDGALSLPATPRGGSGLSASVTNFQFRAKGSTDQAADVTLSVAGAAAALTVDHETGHVR